MFLGEAHPVILPANLSGKQVYDVWQSLLSVWRERYFWLSLVTLKAYKDGRRKISKLDQFLNKLPNKIAASIDGDREMRLKILSMLIGYSIESAKDIYIPDAIALHHMAYNTGWELHDSWITLIAYLTLKITGEEDD